jgi:predicted MFS family arabinose efflux permease
MTAETGKLTGYQLRVLAILALINFVNFADRTVILPLFPLLRAEFGVSDTQLAWLQTVLQIVLSLASIPLAVLADRISRTRIIAAGVVLWSLATFFSGTASTFAGLLFARALVGIGEAAYAPAAQSMISGAFSAAARARAQAVFAAGMLLGGASGQAIGGIMGDKYGWEPAFFVVGFPGLLLALSVLHMEEPLRGPRSELVPLNHLLRVPAFLALNLSGILVTFAAVSFITWGPDFVVREKDFSLREAGVILGLAGFFSLVGGVIVGGFIADTLQKRWNFGRIVTIMMAFLLAAPFIVFALNAETKMMVLAGFFVAGFFMSWYHGPVTAVIHDMMPPRAHATSVGVYMLLTQLIGGTLGPLSVGQVSDRRSLEAGLYVATGAMVLGALTFLLVIYFIRRDGLRHPALDHYHANADD